MNITRKQLVKAFRKWDKDYRTNPRKFQNSVELLLGSTPETYGESATDTLLGYLEGNL
jgi:hypothetical protein